MKRIASAFRQGLSIAVSVSLLATGAVPSWSAAASEPSMRVPTTPSAGANSIRMVDPSVAGANLSGQQVYSSDSILFDESNANGAVQEAPLQEQLSLFPDGMIATSESKAEAVLAAESAKSPAGAQGNLNQLDSAIKHGNSVAAVYDGGGYGFKKSDAPPRNDIQLDPRPQGPKETEGARLFNNEVRLPVIVPGKLTLAHRLLGLKPTPKNMLRGNPQTAAGAEKALRKMIDLHPEEFKGLTSRDLQTVSKYKVIGKAGLSDTIYVNFSQHIDGVPVIGSYVAFTVKIIDGHAIVNEPTMNLYPDLSINTKSAPSEREASMHRAKMRIVNTPESRRPLNDEGLRIMRLDGKWRTVHIYTTEKRTISLAVDINDPQTNVIAWDPRLSNHHDQDRNQKESRQIPIRFQGEHYPLQIVKVTGDVEGTAVGRGVESGPQKPDTALSDLTLGFLKVTVTSVGKPNFFHRLFGLKPSPKTETYYTDIDGKFTVRGTGEQVTVTVGLEGKYVNIQDDGGPALVVTQKAKPGDKLQVIVNPEGADEFAVADVTEYHHGTKTLHRFITEVADIVGDRQITIHTNSDQTCNSYFDMSAIYGFRKGGGCVNSDYDEVVMHELGHYLDYLAHGGTIPNGGLSEAHGDNNVLLFKDVRYVGKDFFIDKQDGNFIRDGGNDYQYNENDEVHEVGKAYMGPTYLIKEAFKPKYGVAEGLARAINLILPVVLVSVPDIPSAAQKVLERAIDKNGNIPDWDIIRDAYAAHGITLKKPMAWNHDPHSMLARLIETPSILSQVRAAAVRAATVLTN